MRLMNHLDRDDLFCCLLQGEVLDQENICYTVALQSAVGVW